MYRTIIFDCDSTLTRIEGIDELARLKGMGVEVAELTRRAMDGEMSLQDVYRVRLDLLTPTRAELQAVAQRYIAECVPEARETVRVLQACGREVFIVSAGLEPCVVEFARWLGVKREQVRAVPPQFDQLAGDWHQFHRRRYGANLAERVIDVSATPLVQQHGKRELIAALPKRGRSMLVGDGMNDWAARESVNLFVGFGGVVRRASVEAKTEVYLTAPTLAAIVPLALSSRETQLLQGEGRRVFECGVRALREGMTRGIEKIEVLAIA
jgi:phosphoserine phosphatase